MQVFSDYLVIGLMFLCNIRAFFRGEQHHDTLAVLAPVSLVLAVLQLVAFGVSWLNVYVFLLAIIVFFSNFHALLRVSSRVYVDHYSPLMIFWAILTTILCVPALLYVFLYHPVEKRSSDMGLEENKIVYTGDFTYGFTQTQTFEKATFFLNEFKREGDDNTEVPVLIFVSDKRADTEGYKPYLQALAKEGFIVYSGDFYAKDLKYLHNFFDYKISRRFFMVLDSFMRSHQFKAQREFYTYNTRKEFEMMMKILDERLGSDTKYFLVSDYMGTVSAQDLMKEKPGKITGTFAMENVENYKSSGYGIIAYTDPFLAQFFDCTKSETESLLEELVVRTESAYFGE